MDKKGFFSGMGSFLGWDDSGFGTLKVSVMGHMCNWAIIKGVWGTGNIGEDMSLGTRGSRYFLHLQGEYPN